MSQHLFVALLAVLILASNQVINAVGECEVNVTIKDGPVIQVNENQQILPVTLVRTGNTSIASEINVTTHYNSSAMNGSDFNSLFKTVPFEPNVSSVIVNLTILNDTKFEDYIERFSVNITSNDTNVCRPFDSVIIEIKDDEKLTVGFQKEFRNFSENVGNITIDFFRRATPTTVITISVRYFTAGIGNATINIDYTNVSSIIEFPDLQYTLVKSNALTIKDNDIVEYTKCFNVSLDSTHPNIVFSHPLMICILNDDKVTVEFRYSNMSIDEELGSISVPVVKIGNAAIPITVRMTNKEDFNTAIKNVDYDDFNGRTITFEKDVSEILFNVTIKPDVDFESTESFFIGIEVLDSTTTTIGSKNLAVIRITDRVDNEVHMKEQKQIEEDQKRRTTMMTYLLYAIVGVLLAIILIFIILVVIIINKMKNYNTL